MDSTQQHSVGATIAALRKQKGWTQEELAKKLNVTDKAVSKWEQNGGTPNLDTIVKLANVFGVSTDYILTGKQGQISWKDTMTLEGICKNDMSVAIENFDTRILIAKDENDLTILDYMLKYPCPKVVEAFFAKFPVDLILSRHHYETLRNRNAQYCLDSYSTEFPLFTGAQVAMVLVEYKMMAQLDHLDLFYLQLLPKQVDRPSQKTLAAYMCDDVNLFTDQFFARILVDDKFKGEFREKYLMYFGTEQYKDAIRYAILTQNDVLFKDLWARVTKINQDFCAMVEEDASALDRRETYPYRWELGKPTKNYCFVVDLGVDFLEWMVDYGYVKAAQNFGKILYPLYPNLTFSADRIRLAELKKQGKGDTYEAARLTVVEDGLLRLDKLPQIKDYQIAKRLITEESVHKFELFCRLLKNKQYDQLLALCGNNKHLKELLDDPKSRRDSIRSVGFNIFIPYHYTSVDIWSDEEQWPEIRYTIKFEGMPDCTEEFDGGLDDDQALDYIQSVKDEVFYDLWKEEEDEAYEKEKQALRQKLIKKYPRSYFLELLDKGDVETAVRKLCYLLEGLLETGYDYEGSLAEMIDEFCYDYEVDDDTFDLLDNLRILRNYYAHPNADYADLTHEELLRCVEIVFEIAE